MCTNIFFMFFCLESRKIQNYYKCVSVKGKHQLFLSFSKNGLLSMKYYLLWFWQFLSSPYIYFWQYNLLKKSCNFWQLAVMISNHKRNLRSAVKLTRLSIVNGLQYFNSRRNLIGGRLTADSVPTKYKINCETHTFWIHNLVRK